MNSDYFQVHLDNTSTPFISIVLATYRREEMLCRTLEALIEQPYPHFEVIVVDQSHEHLPPTKEFLQKLADCGKIRLYTLSKPSLPGARNYGISKAKGEIILFVDDDVDPSPNLLTAHASQYTSPEIGGVAGRRTYPPDSQLYEDDSPIGTIKLNTDHISNFSSNLPLDSVDWASGCNMSFRKSALVEIGGFDVNFIGSAVYEDVDVCYRLRNQGHRIVFSPEAHLVPLVAPSGGCGNRTRNSTYYYSFFHNSLLFTLKNLPMWRWPVVFVSRFFMSLALTRQTGTLQSPLLFVRGMLRAFNLYLRSMSWLQDGR